jgi:hypothetical protein
MNEPPADVSLSRTPRPHISLMDSNYSANIHSVDLGLANQSPLQPAAFGHLIPKILPPYRYIQFVGI